MTGKTEDQEWIADSLSLGSFFLKDPETGERLFVASPLTDEEDGCSSFTLADGDGVAKYKMRLSLEEV